MLKRRGFTMVELVLTMSIAGVAVGLAAPRLQTSVGRIAMRSATSHVTNAVAAARLTAANRGCPAVLHLDGTTSRVWITSCRPSGAGQETVSSDYMKSRFKVAMSASADSVRFIPTGTRADWSTTTIRFQHQTLSLSDSVRIDALGRVTP